MILSADFLEVFFKALMLIGLAAAVGGVIFVFAVLRPPPLTDNRQLGQAPLRRSLLLIVSGACMLAVAQGIILLVELWALADELGRLPVSMFLATGFAHAGLLHAGMALLLAASALLLLMRPASRFNWRLLAVSTALLIVSGAWLVHAVSRMEHAVPLMTVTIIHQFGAAIWAGGVLHLTALWRLIRNSPERRNLWPRLVARFSRLAVFSVGMLAAAGLYLSFRYIGKWEGLIATAYGTMVLTKISLLAFALCLGGLNFLTVKRWKQKRDSANISERVPFFVEAEMVTATVIILSAAALTSQTPSVDVLTEQATPMEVLQVFAPKLPHLTPPHYRETASRALPSAAIFGIPDGLPNKPDALQSNFNNNIAGLLVLAASICALLSRSPKIRVARHWPLLLLPLGLFLVLFSEPTGWPFGTVEFWEIIILRGMLHHRLATLLVIGLSLLEWRVQAGSPARGRWRFVFPVLCVSGGALLLTHSHTDLADKQTFLIEVSHNAIAFLTVIMGAGRLLELRLSEPAKRIPGVLWPLCMMLIGFVLLFYREI